MDKALAIGGLCVACVLGRVLLELVGEALLQGLCYWTARIVVPALTMGRIRVSDLRNPPKGLEAAGIQTLDDGRRIISVDWAVGIGLAIWLAVLGLVIAAAIWWPAPM